MTAPLVVSDGIGVDSTAMLLGMHARGMRPDLILFADTGSEKPETYAYLDRRRAWLRAVGFPELTVVRYKLQRPKNGYYDTLEGNCLVNATLPSLAFGRKACSQKWKVEPMDRFVGRWQPAAACWATGGKVVRAIGYDAGPKDSKRAWRLTEDDRYRYWYPLRDWGWDRERCVAEIEAASLPVPMKSACFFCPASQPEEIDWLCDEHPDLAERIVAIEERAKPGLRTIGGLWGRGTKGTRGGKVRPPSMTEHIRRRLPLIQP